MHTTVKWRKHVYWLLLSVFKLIFVSYLIIFEFLGSVLSFAKFKYFSTSECTRDILLITNYKLLIKAAK